MKPINLKSKLIAQVGLAALVAGGAVLWSSPAMAQDSARRIAIAELPLAVALRELGQVSQAQIIFDEGAVEGFNSRPVLTDADVDAALTQMLEGTGLEFRKGETGVYVVGTAAALAAAQSAAAVPAAVESGVIVVSGRRVDDELSINVKRNAEQVVDVLTAAASSRLPDNNVAESLSRIAGVAVQRNGETGTGDFISIRGLDSALVNVSFDGVTGGTAGGSNRSVPLDGITSDNVAEIRVSKSLLPSDEGVGVGGAVNIVSRTPLNGGKEGFRLNAAGRYNEFADKFGYEVGGTMTKVFNDSFGINLSASFRQRYMRNLEMDSSSSHISGLKSLADASGKVLTGQQLFDLGLKDAGTHFDDVQAGLLDPALIVFEDYSYQVQDQARKTYSLSGAADWRISDSTLLTLGGRLNLEKSRAQEYSLTFDEDDQDFMVVGGALVPIFNDAELDVESQIEDETRVNASGYLKGVTETGRLKLEYLVSYAQASRNTPQTNFGFDTDRLIDRAPRGVTPVQFHPYSFVNTYFPVPDLANFARPGFERAVTDIPGTQIFDSFSALLKNKSLNKRYSARFDATYDADIPLFGGAIKSFRVGGKYERSDLNRTTKSLLNTSGGYLNLDGTYQADGRTGTASLATLGSFPGLYAGLGNNSLRFVGSPLKSLGITAVPFMHRDGMTTFRNNLINSYTGPIGEGFSNNREETFAGYAMTTIDLGRLDMSGGLRVEHYRGSFFNPGGFGAQLLLIDCNDATDPDPNTNCTGVPNRPIRLNPVEPLETVNPRSSNTEFLPRFNARWEVANNLQVRLGAGYSLARPSYGQLGQSTNVNLALESDPNITRRPPVAPGAVDAQGVVSAGGINVADISAANISISSGNPDLKNARSLNLDLSLEYYPMRGTAFTIGLFHKRIKNFIFVGQEAGSGALNTSFIENLLTPEGKTLIDQMGGIQGLIDNVADTNISIKQPTNGDLATVSGVEFGVNHQFKYLPGALSHFGVSGNLSLMKSRADFVVVAGASELNPGGGLENNVAQTVLGYSKPGDALVRRTSFYRAPPVIANGTVYYEDKSLEVALSASYQGDSFRAPDEYGIDQYTKDYFQLDLFASYTAQVGGAELKFFVEVPDITDTGTKGVDIQTAGRNGRAFDEASFNGREVKFGVRAKF